MMETTPQSAAPESKPAIPVNQPGRGFLVWARDLVLSVLVSGFVIVFVYQPVKVEGTSMMPMLKDQERIFINKYVYRWEPISRGDVVVFRYPGDPSKSYIKRVIGLPGDRVQISFGRVYVNGERLHETYVPENYSDERSISEIYIPADSYFVLGDHRSMSSDSRDFGPVNRSYIYGKAVFAYWPANRMGKVE